MSRCINCIIAISVELTFEELLLVKTTTDWLHKNCNVKPCRITMVLIVVILTIRKTAKNLSNECLVDKKLIIQNDKIIRGLRCFMHFKMLWVYEQIN